MKKIIITLFIVKIFVGYFSEPAPLNAQSSQFILEITNVTANGGDIHVSIFKNAEEFKNELPSTYFVLGGSGVVVRHTMELPAADYLFTAYQDTNNNGKCDFNFLGMPRELVALSNYSGKGIPPRDFNKLKVPVNSTIKTITIRLNKF